MIRTLFLLVVLLLGTSPAEAHERSRSTSNWVITGDHIHGSFLLDARQATLFLAVMPEGTTLEGGFRARLVEGLAVTRNGDACQLASIPDVSLLPDGRLRGVMDWTCPQSQGPVEFNVQVFAPFSPNHIHFLRARMDGGNGLEFVLTRGRNTAQIAPEAEPMSWFGRVSQYFGIGVEHILGGADHLAFLAGLLLVVRRWRDTLGVTLGFTLGHSITLAAAYFGWVSPPGAAIEALIGFSIFFVAGEAALGSQPPKQSWALPIAAAILALGLVNLVTGGAIQWPVWIGLSVLGGSYLAWLSLGGQADRALPGLSAGFGLVHGVGFAGILLEFDLPAGDRVPALAGFNLGVETGQLIFVLAALATTQMAHRVVPDRVLAAARPVLIAMLAGLGTFWFVSRAWA